MKKLMFKGFILIAAGIFIFSCSQKLNEKISTKEESAIKPPFKGIDIQIDTYWLNASEDSKIRTKEGTTITIPANSLLDKNGKLVKGKFEFAYRSINTPGEIVASGIPMSYDSAGVKNDFISAGMFEIGAKQKGNELTIAPGKNVDVDFASYKEGDDFNFYKINKKSGKWSYKGKTKSKKNLVKVEQLKKFKEDNLLLFDIDYSTHKELKPFNGLKWLCLNEEGVENPCKNDWMLKEAWYDISLKIIDAEKGVYEVNLSNSNKNSAFKVSPYQLESDIIAGMNDKINTLNETVKLKKEEEERIQFEADITRNFKISSFGMYNWDKIEKEVAAGNLVVTNANFKVDSKELDKEMKIFHFSGKDKLLSRMDKKWDKLLFDPKDVNKFLIVLPDNYVALSNPSEFLYAKDKANFMFNLKKRAQKIKSIKELDDLLAGK